MANIQQHRSSAPTAAADDNSSLIIRWVLRLLAIQRQQQRLTDEERQLHARLQTAHGHGELLRFWTADGGGMSYRIRPDLMLHRQPGAKIWHYSQSCQQLEDELLKQQSYEQQSGRAS